MQSVFVVLCLVAALAVVHCQEKYSDKYDNINLDEILSNERLFKSHLDCVLDLGKCSPEGLELKKHVPEALTNKCAKCTDKQKEGSKKVVNFLLNKKRSDWDKIVAKYDPAGKFKADYADELKAEGIIL